MMFSVRRYTFSRSWLLSEPKIYLMILICLIVASCGTHRVTQTDNKPAAQNIYDRDDKAGKKREESTLFAKRLIAEARTWLGTPYLYGGKDKKGADCSGFIMMVFKNAHDVALPRTSRDQCNYCNPISKECLEPGDLIFFSSKNSGGKVAHVGLYIGNGNMIHASSSKGVVETSLEMKYYVDHYLTGGRIPQISESYRAKSHGQSTKPSDNNKTKNNKQSEGRQNNPSPETIVKNAFNRK